MNRAIFVSVFCLLFLISQAQKKVALIIGNASYEYLEELSNPINDANDISFELERIGFEVFTHLNLDREELKSAISEFATRIAHYDIVLIYYAGHGLEVNGRNFLVPVDAFAYSSKEVSRTCIPASALTRILPQNRNQSYILMLDACRNNPFTLIEEKNKGLALMDAPPETIISFATAPGKVANDGNGRNSPFATSLLNYLFFYDLDIKELFEKVRSNVMQLTNNRQVPWESTSLTKKVVLRRKPEMELHASIMEGDTVNFIDRGNLHGKANLNQVSYAWFKNGNKLGNYPTIEVDESGDYLLRVMSLQGKVAVVSCHINVQSSIVPVVFIAEGKKVFLEEGEALHAKANVQGEFKWYKEAKLVATGPVLDVKEPGLYNISLVTSDGQVVTSSSTEVKIK